MSIEIATAEQGPMVGQGPGVRPAVGVVATTGSSGVEFASVAVAGGCWGIPPTCACIRVADEPPHAPSAAARTTGASGRGKAREDRGMPGICLSSTVDRPSLAHRSVATTSGSDEVVQTAVRGHDVELAVGALTPARDIQARRQEGVRGLRRRPRSGDVPDSAAAVVPEEVAARESRVGSAAVDEAPDDGAADRIVGAVPILRSEER